MSGVESRQLRSAFSWTFELSPSFDPCWSVDWVSPEFATLAKNQIAVKRRGQARQMEGKGMKGRKKQMNAKKHKKTINGDKMKQGKTGQNQ